MIEAGFIAAALHAKLEQERVVQEHVEEMLRRAKADNAAALKALRDRDVIDVEARVVDVTPRLEDQR